MMYLFEDHNRNSSLSGMNFEQLEEEIGGLYADDCYLYTLQGYDILNHQKYRLVYTTTRTREVRKEDGSVYYHTIFRIRKGDDYVEELVYTIPCETIFGEVGSNLTDQYGFTYEFDSNNAKVKSYNPIYDSNNPNTTTLVIPNYVKYNDLTYPVTMNTTFNSSSVNVHTIILPMFYSSSISTFNCNENIKRICFENHFDENTEFHIRFGSVTKTFEPSLDTISFSSKTVTFETNNPNQINIDYLIIFPYQTWTIPNTFFEHKALNRWYIEGDVVVENAGVIKNLGTNSLITIYVYSLEKYITVHKIFDSSIRSSIQIMIPFVELSYQGDPLIYKNGSFSYPDPDIRIGGFVEKDGHYDTIDLNMIELSFNTLSNHYADNEVSYVDIHYGDLSITVPYVSQSMDYTEVKLWNSSGVYITKNGILVTIDDNQDGVKIVGIAPGYSPTMLDIEPYVKVVSEFTSENR